jgi:hypothetical protein
MRIGATVIGAVLCAGLLATAAVAAPISTERKSEFEKALNVVLATVAPHMSGKLRDTLIREYVDSPPNKAQAIEPKDGSPWRSTKREDLDAAADRALEACQLRYAKPCALLALNEEIAAEGAPVTKDMPRLQYAGEFDLAKIPIIRAPVRARADIQGYSGAPGPKAIAIHPWGTLFISTGKANLRDAQDAALAECNADRTRNSKDGNCFVYAVGNQVVLAERRQIGK